jgi:HPt (histidine-containing phosphotransfer) domain-containing protein
MPLIEETAPALESPPEEALNADELLDAFGGDRDLLRDVAEVFLAECPTLLAGVEQAVATRNREALRQAAHKLKGAIAPFSRKAAYRTGYELENTAQTADWPNLESLLANLKTQVARMQAALGEQTQQSKTKSA